MANEGIDLTEATVRKLKEQFKILNIKKGAEKSPLLSLPAELRRPIFRDALRSPPKWDLRHVRGCPHHGTSRFKPEIPPFMLSRADHGATSGVTYYGEQPRMWSAGLKSRECRCSFKAGFGLVLASRQCYAEAAPMFYEMNTFCFDTVPQLYNILSKVNPNLLALIRHISIMGLTYDFERTPPCLMPFNNYWTRRAYSPSDELAWELLCNRTPHLENLEIRVESVVNRNNVLQKFNERLPHCRISVVQLGAVSISSTMCRHYGGLDPFTGSLLRGTRPPRYMQNSNYGEAPQLIYNGPFIYVKLSRLLELKEKGPQGDPDIGFTLHQWNSLMRRCQIAAHELFGSSTGDISGAAIQKYNAIKNEVELDLQLEIKTVTMYGLPPAKFSLPSHFNGQRMQRVQPTREQGDGEYESGLDGYLDYDEPTSSGKGRGRGVRLNDKVHDDSESEQETPEQKQLRRAEKAEARAEDEKKQSRKQKAKVNRRVKQQAKVQQNERKRVPTKK